MSKCDHKIVPFVREGKQVGVGLECEKCHVTICPDCKEPIEDFGQTVYHYTHCAGGKIE